MHSSNSGHHDHHRHSRRRAFLRRLFHRCSKVAWLIALATIGLFPMAWGGGQPWWYSGALLMLVSAFAIWMVGIWWMGEGTYQLQFSWGALLFAIPLGYGVLQCLPLGQSIVAKLSPAAARYWAEAGTMPWGERVASLTLAPDATLHRCGLYLGCLILFLLLSSLARHRRYMIGVLVAVVIAAVGNAAQYYVQAFVQSGAGRSLTGVFLNRNHFGFLMTMGIMSLSGLLAMVVEQGKHHRRRSPNSRRNDNDIEPPHGMVSLLSFGLLFLVVAQALCLSRGAFLTSTIGLVVFWCTWALHQQKRQRKTGTSDFRQMMVPAILLAGALCVAMPWILEALSERYQELLKVGGLDSEGRLRVWKISLGLFRHFGFLGTGLGAYGVAVQPLELGQFTSNLIYHAHNDILELCCEIGLPLMLFLLGLGGFFWWRTLHVVRRQRDVVYHWLGMGAVVALASCFAHEWVEFSLLAWPNAFCFTALLAVATACQKVHHSRPSAHQRTSSQTNSALAGLVAEMSVADELPAGSDTAKNTDTEIFEDPEEAERRLRSEARHQRHEALRRNRWRYRLAYLAFAFILVGGVFPVLVRSLKSGLQIVRLQARRQHLAEERSKFGQGGSVRDYEKMQGMATRALQRWNSNRPRVLTMRAALRQELARLVEVREREQRNVQDTAQLRNLALEDLAEACRRLPGQGDYAFQYARALERAVSDGASSLSWTDVLRVYEWALSRQPGMVENVREVADVYGRAWVVAMRARQVAEAATYRQRAIDGYLHSLDLASSSRVLARLRLLRVPLEEILTHITPGEGQLRFFHSLVASQDYATAARLLEKMPMTLPSGEKKLTNEEWRVQFLQARRQFAELTADVFALERLWQELRGAEESFQLAKLEEARLLREAGDAWSADQLLHQLVTLPRPSAQVALARARQMRLLGSSDEVVMALLPLAYNFAGTAPELLVQALDMLDACAGAIAPTAPMRLRLDFLRNALAVQLYNNNADSVPASREALSAAVRRLEELDASLEEASSRHWVQEHLISYYAGMGREALDEPEQATKDYLKCLKKCPKFLYGLQRLAKLRPELLKDGDRQLLVWAKRLENPVGFLSKGLQWLALETTPVQISELHEIAQCTFALLCTDDIYTFTDIRVSFLDRHGVVFQKNLLERQMGGRLLTTQVGEVLLLEVPIQPVVDAARGAHRTIQNGQLVAKIRDCYAPVLTIHLDRGNRK